MNQRMFSKSRIGLKFLYAAQDLEPLSLRYAFRAATAPGRCPAAAPNSGPTWRRAMIDASTATFRMGDRTVNRVGYGAMQLAGPGVFGPPKDHAEALAVLREAVASGVNHIDTSDFYGPHVTNHLIREALQPLSGRSGDRHQGRRPARRRRLVDPGAHAGRTDQCGPRQPAQPRPRCDRCRQPAVSAKSTARSTARSKRNSPRSPSCSGKA